MKDSADVVAEFGELVNMTAKELREWLESEDSQSAGWSGDKTDGESVGHESGRKIIQILESNPKMEADKYTEEQVQHMRKVVSYCKRHLAQEERSNNEKPVEEVVKTKSFASLKNWGHDCIKAREGKKGGQEGGKPTAKGQKAGDKREAAVVIDDDEEEEKGKAKAKETGKGAEKKRKTEEDDGGEKELAEEEEDEFEEVEEEGDEDFEDVGDEEDEEDDEGEGEGEGEGGDEGGEGEKKKGKGKGPQKGDTVSWNWAGGQPQGKVLDVKGEETSIQTKRGNEVSRKGKPDDPAVVLDTGSSKALKLDHELNH